MRTRSHFSVYSWLATTLAYCAMSALSQEAVAGERVLKAVTKEGEVNLSVNARKVGTGSVEILASGLVSNADPSHQFTTLYQLRQITKDGAPKEPAPDSGGAPAVPATAVPLPTADAADSDKTVYATPLEAASAAIAAYRLKDSQKLLDMSVSPVAPELTDAYKPGTEAYEKFFKEDSELSQGVHKFKGQFTSVRLNDEAYVLIKTPSFFSGPTYVHMLREKGEFYYSPAEMVRVDKLPPPIALLPETDPDYKEIEARTAVVRKALASGSTDELGAVMAGDTLQKTIDYFTEFGEGDNFFGDGSAEAFAKLVPKQLQIDAGRSRLKVVNIYRGQTVYFVLSSTGEPDTVTEVACCVIVAKQDDQWKLDRIRTMLALELPTQKFSF
ncbi:MAG: hypothetical protein KDB01_03970 [Planctomycetaceae bacterium]|nr:hypothetical protein [Planctomycetaceae bacterium]